MIRFERFILPNGLKVLVHEDPSTPMAAVNLLYDVGARDEQESKTGFAHLFEHLMFEGSVNIPSYDGPLQLAGGSNNAFTSNDITNYYVTLPAANLETAFWLESDRMLELAFRQEKLDIQKKVVIEEFKQRYLNQPYGDIWLLMRPLAYTTHPYKWATIGKEIGHIELATMDDVKQFFFRHYAPNNAILTVAGGVKTETVKALAEKWFGPIPKRDVPVRQLPQEPPQEEERRLKVERNVPSDAIMVTFRMGRRMDADYPAIDLISDILSSGKSARLYEKLVKKRSVFTEIGAYVMGSLDPGLLVIFGKLDKHYTMHDAEEGIWEVLNEMKEHTVSEAELEKVKNKLETNERFGMLNVLNIAMKLGFAELLGDPDLVNKDMDLYRKVTAAEIQQTARRLFDRRHCCVMEYDAQV